MFKKEKLVENNTQNHKKVKKNIFGKTISVIIILLLVGVFGWQIFIFSGLSKVIGTTNSIFDNSNLDLFSFVKGSVKLKGEDRGRTNILLFGINEFDGDGLGTVDTNIVLSYFHKEKKLSTISIMRDLRVDGNIKINAAYPSIEPSIEQNTKYQSYLSRLLKIDIDYYTKINMKGAMELIDKVGGIEVDIPNTFRDWQYPKMGDYSFKFCPERGQRDAYMCPAPVFTKGRKKMMGDEALIFARSRKGMCYFENGKFWDANNCIENGDDARGKRQQIVIQALINKIKEDFNSGKVSLNTTYLQGILDVLGENVKTSFNIAEGLSLLYLIKDNVDVKDMKKVTISYQATKYKNDLLLLCSDRSSSDIILCDNTTFSINNLGNYATRLRQIFTNPLSEIDEEIKPIN